MDFVKVKRQYFMLQENINFISIFFLVYISFISQSHALDECYVEIAEAYEVKANNGSGGADDYLQIAYDIYICSARNGNYKAAYRAALLTQSGQVSVAKNEDVESLLMLSAAGGVVDARIALANFYCGSDVNTCLKPKEAGAQLLLAAKFGSPDGVNMLGAFYEKGWLGVVDIDRAFSCYKKASEMGNSFAKNNIERIKIKLTYPMKNVPCFE